MGDRSAANGTATVPIRPAIALLTPEATPPRHSRAALRSLTVMHGVGAEPTRWTQWMAGARLLGAVSPVAVVAVGAGIETVAGTLLAVGVFGVLLDPLIRPFAWARDEVAGREQTFTIPQEQDR